MEREREQDLERELGLEREREQGLEREQEQEQELERERERERGLEREQEQEQERERGLRMNTVILTLVLFFNGTTHTQTGEYNPVDYPNPMESCTFDATQWVKALAGPLANPSAIPALNTMTVKIISVQCTVQPLKE